MSHFTPLEVPRFTRTNKAPTSAKNGTLTSKEKAYFLQERDGDPLTYWIILQSKPKNRSNVEHVLQRVSHTGELLAEFATTCSLRTQSFVYGKNFPLFPLI